MIAFLRRLKVPFALVAILWSLEIYEWLSGASFTTWGILPRKLSGLKGILTSPFIHSDWDHLMSNTVPLFTLSMIMVIFYRRVATASILLIYLLTGAMVWMFARGNYVVGASGVVYGLVSFVFWTGVFKRDAKSIVLSLIVLTVYYGFFAGILPQEERISWESHLFGALVGVFVAYLFKDVVHDDDDTPTQVSPAVAEEQEYFLPRDIFVMTKAERAEAARQDAYRRQQEALLRLREQGYSGPWSSDHT